MLPKELQESINQLKNLPGIGEKTAQKLALFMLKQSEEANTQFANAIINAKKNVGICPECFNYTSGQGWCSICLDTFRNGRLLMIVPDVKSLYALEATKEYHGRYHVLGGLISPMEGIGPDKLNINGLINSIKNKLLIEEVILALGASIEANATNLYLSKLLEPLKSVANIKLTEIGYGISVGSELENADAMSIAKAIKNRKDL